MIRIAPFIIGLFLLSGCYESLHPISPPRAGMLDERLLGTWYVKEEADISFFHIGKTSHPFMIFIVSIAHAGDDGLKHEQYIAHGSKIDNTTYLNIHRSDRDTDTRVYLFIKYHIGEDILTYSITDPDVVEADIMNGTVRGELLGHTPVVTAEPEEIMQYLRKNDSRLFRKAMIAHRPALPSTIDERDKTSPGQGAGELQ